MFLCRKFKFDAAHNLVNYHGKCERLHGHTYKISVMLKGSPDSEGMIYDFTELKSIVNEIVLSKLDHSYINDIIPQPTAEYIAQWIFRVLDGPLRRENCELFEICVWETENSYAVCHREDV
jgi:6-pyruvoyltetrahydropterin/6-carboxytetrahydropterin synthase